jgi:hypothetical protein
MGEHLMLHIGAAWKTYVTNRGKGINLNLILHWYRGEHLMLHIGARADLKVFQ